MDYSFILGAQRDAAIAERDGLLKDATPETFTPESEARVAELNKEIREIGEKLDQARKDEAAEVESRSAEPVATARAQTTTRVMLEPNPVYRKSDPENSFFRDMFHASQPTSQEHTAARDRMQRSQETRALSTTATAGGTFAPPEWLVSEYVALARAARVTADLVKHQDLPSGVSSINIPKISTGTTVGVTQTQNTAVSNTDIVTTSVSSGITTIAGQQVVSLELINQSGIPFDDIILGDLALAYASQIDVQVLSGTGANGQLKGLTSAGTTVTYTTTAPSVISTTAANSFYNKVINAVATLAKTRFLPANAIVMHPVRWGWILEALDGQSRPLVVPNGPIYNNLAVTGDTVAQGMAGTFAGLPVYLDPNIVQNLGAATNQDQVYVLRTDDHVLWETPVERTRWDATYANQNSVLFRALAFSAFITRYAASAQIIDGTGLVTPTL